jgi:hypothetical protein
MTQPPKLTAPLATIPLPDGTELRLVHVARGDTFTFDDDATFSGRVYPESNWYRSYSLGEHDFHASAQSIWMVFTQFDPRSKDLTFPNFQGFWIVEEKGRFTHRLNTVGWQTNACLSVCAEVFPRRDAQWRVQINYHGAMIQGTIPNPFPVIPKQEFAPKGLPLKATIDGATFEFTGLKPAPRSTEKIAFSPDFTGLPGAAPVVKITMGDLHEGSFTITHELFDATGNVTTGGVLPFGEPAWGIKIRAVQRDDSRSNPATPVVLGEVAIPGPEEIQALPIPPFLAALGVTDILFVGPGRYTFSPYKVRTVGANGKVRVLKIANDLRGTSRTITGTGILLLSTLMSTGAPGVGGKSFAEGNQRITQAIFRLRDGANVIPASSLGSSTSSGPGRGNSFGVFDREFRLPKMLQSTPDAKVRVEYFSPKVLEATFYFPPPNAMDFR